ncbi:MAG: hypothetical protein OEM52_07805, partial [bacterium]|nr:hypothetical protein [bacterium]
MMYRRYSGISTLVLTLLLTAGLFAQPLTGTKYVGGNAPDYATISAAITALNSNGVGTGGVTFRIRGGVYTEAPDSLMWTMNTSYTARVAFVPDDTLGVFINKQSTTSARFAFSFNNADFITIDGSHPNAPGRKLISIQAADTAFGQWALRFINGSSYNVIRNVVLSVGLASTSTNARVIFFNPSSSFQPLSGCKADSFYNCRIQGGYTGAYLTGESIIMNDSLYFGNNEFVDFNVYGGYVAYTRYSVWEKNDIYRTAPGTATIYGIYHNNSNSNFGKFIGNRVHDLEGGTNSSVYGLYLNNGSNLLAANNMINLAPAAGGTVYGLYLGTNTVKVFYNTIRVGGATGGNNNSAAITISGVSTDSLLNNIFVNERAGGSLTTNYHTAATYSSSTPFAYSNNNVFANTSTSTDDNQYGIRYSSTSYNTLEDLLGAGTAYVGDDLSFSAIPRFVSDTDLHIDVTQRTQVESAAQPIDITVDFDGQTRNATTPDIGADEGNFISGGDFVPPTIQHAGLPTYNYVTSRVVMAVIRDNVGIATAPNHPRIYSRSTVDTAWTFRNADSVRSDSLYYFHVPGVPYDEQVEYYFAAQDIIGNSVTLPSGGA